MFIAISIGFKLVNNDSRWTHLQILVWTRSSIEWNILWIFIFQPYRRLLNTLLDLFIFKFFWLRFWMEMRWTNYLLLFCLLLFFIIKWMPSVYWLIVCDGLYTMHICEWLLFLYLFVMIIRFYFFMMFSFGFFVFLFNFW